MAADVGIWIDRREATLVHFAQGEPRVRKILSGVAHTPGDGEERTTRSKKPAGAEGKAEITAMGKFYDKVAKAIGDADSIALIGPASAKLELRRTLRRAKLDDLIVVFQTAERMTDRRLVVHLRGLLSLDVDKERPAVTRKEQKSRRNSKTPDAVGGRASAPLPKPKAETTKKRQRGPAAQVVAKEGPKTQAKILAGTGHKNLYANMPRARKKR